MNPYRIMLGQTPFPGQLRRLGGVLALVGIAAFIVGGLGHPQYWWGGYLLGFIYAMGLSVTLVFFSALSYLVNAGWVAAVRRIPEMLSSFVLVLPVAALPLVIGALTGNIYEWMHSSDEHLHHGFKGLYLSQPFFWARLVFYAVVWIGMHRVIVGNSLRQDDVTDITPTQRNWKLSAPFVLLYALTITFASFDLVMTLEPHWFSTIFGVYSFAGHFVASLALMLIVMRMLERGGYLAGILSREHYHDVGKLLFAFTIFWTYVAFSQYFIIWYGNLPEETVFFAKRLSNGWEIFGWASLFGHFVIPFLFLLRQDVKRQPQLVTIGALILLIAHAIDLSWVILPVFSAAPGEPYQLSWALVLTGWGAIAAMLGAVLIVASRAFARHSAVACNDPYLHESLDYHSGAYDPV
ncbi:MAG: membrane protein [Candidatus Kapaibacterium sp.]|nr:MAG: membrane protein [Candidatus Kapabacteria bacterium]